MTSICRAALARPFAAALTFAPQPYCGSSAREKPLSPQPLFRVQTNPLSARGQFTFSPYP